MPPATSSRCARRSSWSRPTSGPCCRWPPFWSNAASDADREEALGLLARLPETPAIRHLAAQARLGAELEDGRELDPDGIEAKLDGLLDRVREDDSARQEFVDLLELLGPEDPRTASYRKALTARLF